MVVVKVERNRVRYFENQIEEIKKTLNLAGERKRGFFVVGD